MQILYMWWHHSPVRATVVWRSVWRVTCIWGLQRVLAGDPICQIYVKHKQKTNRTMRLIKEIKENRRKGPGVSLGPKVQRLRTSHDITRHQKTDKVSQAQRFKDFEDGSKASRTLRWLHEGFPLTITPP